MLPTYPTNDFNQGYELLKQLGSFWINTFQSKEELQSFLHGSAQEFAQTHINMLETVACLSRFNVPVFHIEDWYLLIIKKSDANTITSIYQPDDLQYGPQDGSVEERPAGLTQIYGGVDKVDVIQAPLPPSMVDCPIVLQNLVVLPSKVWVKGVDYSINKEQKTIRFRDDPFKDSLVAKREIFDELGVVIDEEIALWVYKGEFDLDYVFTHFGYALNLKLKTSEGYKEIVNTVWDMHLLGASVEGLSLFLSAMSGAQTIIDPEETIEVVRVEENSQLVVTSSRVYRFPLAATLTVTEGNIGDILFHGDPLSDAFSISELSKDSPDYSLLPAISLSRNFRSGQQLSELTFKNHSVSLDYLGTDIDGKAIVRFETFGFPGDIDFFWDYVHTAGVAQGKTLANYLDQRENPPDEPGPLALPATVNPMQFMIENLLKNNLFVIKVKQASFSTGAPGINLFRLLRDVIPPHTTYVVYVEISDLEDIIDLENPGDEEEAGAEEEISNFLGTSALDQSYELSESPGGDVSTYEDISVLAKQVSLTCE